MRPIPSLRSVLRISAFSLALAACSDSPTAALPDGTERAPIQLSANVSGTPISTLVVTVSAMNIDPPLVFNLEVVSGVAQGTLEVPVGASRNFAVNAYDTSGEVTHTGSQTVNVARNGNPPISIPLTPVRGEVEVVISMGDYSVVVTPASATLAVGQSQQLTATISAPNGDAATDSPVWATLNPSIAAVDANGLVTAVGPGTVDIVATYDGVAGKSVITVTGGATTTWFQDADEDGYGDPAVSTTSSTQPVGYVDNDQDCDDADSSIHPEAVEVADGADNDCDDLVDEGTASTSTGQIVFTRLAAIDDGDPNTVDVMNHNIFVMNSDGSGQINLTSDPATDTEPVPSPDGTKIAFVSNRDGNDDIFMMNADGSNQTNLTSSPGRDTGPVWSHDGTRIAFESDRDGNVEIYAMDATGSGQTNLSNDLATDYEPVWSPDDTRIAFTSGRNGNDDVYVIGASGSGLVQLTVNEFDDDSPAWSPSGDLIAYVAEDTVETDIGTMRLDEIAVVGPDGTGRILLTASGVQSLFHLSWSSDGQKVLHVGLETVFSGPNFETETTSGIFVVNLDGTDHVNLSSVSGKATSNPAWSPDGTRIVFTSNRSGNDEVYVMNADGTNETNLSNNPVMDHEPAWLPAVESMP